MSKLLAKQEHLSGLSVSKMAGNWWKIIKHSGRPSTCTTPDMIAKVHEVILEDSRQTIHDVCNRVGLSYGSC